jgi:DNA-binding transcriptional ArsR family regulator
MLVSMTAGKTAVITQLAPAFDPATGEHLADVHIETAVRMGRKRAKSRGGFVMLQKAALKKLDLTAAQWQVFSQLLGHMDHTNAESRVQVGEIAENLGIAQPNVSRAMKALQDRRIVFRLGLGRYRISSHIAHLTGDDAEVRDTDPTPEWRPR